MKKYDLSAIMRRAWIIFRKAANVTEEAHTWAEWQSLGYEVVRGSKAIFRAVLIWASRGDGRQYMASFFGASQVRPLAD